MSSDLLSRATLVAEATSGHQPSLSRSLSRRLDNLKEQYRKDLEPLTADQERLTREVNDLRETREVMMSESATLHARNEELADLQASLQRQVEAAQETLHRAQRHGQLANTVSFGAGRHHHVVNSPSISSLAPGSSSGHEEEIAKFVRVVKPETLDPPVAAKKFKWYGGKTSKGPEHSHSHSTASAAMVAQSRSSPTPPSAPIFRARGSQDANAKEHSFASHSIPTLRFVRCDHCGDKMWGAVTELRCSREWLEQALVAKRTLTPVHPVVQSAASTAIRSASRASRLPATIPARPLLPSKARLPKADRRVSVDRDIPS